MYGRKQDGEEAVLGRAVTHGNVIGRHRKRECKRYPKRGKRRQEVELPEPSFDMRPTNPYAATLADEGEQRRLAPLGLQAGVGAHDADQLARRQAKEAAPGAKPSASAAA